MSDIKWTSHTSDEELCNWLPPTEVPSSSYVFYVQCALLPVWVNIQMDEYGLFGVLVYDWSGLINTFN